MKDASLMASCMLGMHSTMLSLVTSSTGTREKVDVILNTNGGDHTPALVVLLLLSKVTRKNELKAPKLKLQANFTLYFYFYGESPFLVTNLDS